MSIDAEKMENRYQNTTKQFKKFIFCSFLMIISGIFTLIVVDLMNKGIVSQQKYGMVIVVAAIIFLSTFIAYHISIYRMAKVLNKNAWAWLFACLAFPGLTIIVTLYFSINVVFIILKFKISGGIYKPVS